MASTENALPTEVAFELLGHQGAVRAVRFNRTGSYCLTCGSDRTVRLWNPHKGLPVKSYSGHGAEVLDADSSHDNSRIVSGGVDKLVLLLDVGTGQPIRKLRGHLSRINCVKFNEEATLIISGSYDASVRIWDCRTRVHDPVQVMDEAKDSVTSLRLTNSEILTGSVDGKVRRYDMRFGKLFTDTIGQSVTCVSHSHDGHCVLVSTLDSKLRLFDKDSGEMLNEYSGHVNSDYKLDSCLSQDDSHVISGSEDGRVCFWDLVEGHLVHTLQLSKKGDRKPPIVYSLCWHPTRPTLLSAGSHGPVTVWKPTGWREQDDDEQ
ncbi:WD repeat domain-containing protein 83-like [Halichondria panicea]|uniref:WD repeat domain-containing protein 83-like n=1 Tax=Halichondria panicea TaxID=6063 RepID=UPI00312B9FCC